MPYSTEDIADLQPGVYITVTDVASGCTVVTSAVVGTSRPRLHLQQYLLITAGV